MSVLRILERLRNWVKEKSKTEAKKKIGKLLKFYVNAWCVLNNLFEFFT